MVLFNTCFIYLFRIYIVMALKEEKNAKKRYFYNEG